MRSNKLWGRNCNSVYASDSVCMYMDVYMCIYVYLPICLPVHLPIYSANISHSCSSLLAAGSNSVGWRDGFFSWGKVISGAFGISLGT